MAFDNKRQRCITARSRCPLHARCFGLSAVLVCVASVSVTPGETRAAETVAAVARQQREDDGDRRERRLRRRERGPRSPRLDPQEVAERLPELQERMWKELDLSGEQKESIGTMFDEQILVVRNAVAESKNPERTRRIERLRRQMQQARRVDNAEKEADARAALRELLREKADAENVRLSSFLRSINRELSETQQESFRDQIIELGLMRQRQRAGRLRIYRAAALHEDVGLDASQKEEIRTALRDLLPQGRGDRANEGRESGARRERGNRDRGGSGDRERRGRPRGDREEVEAAFLKRVKEILTDEQFRVFESKLEEFEENPPRPERRRGRRQRRSSDDDQDSEDGRDAGGDRW